MYNLDNEQNTYNYIHWLQISSISCPYGYKTVGCTILLATVLSVAVPVCIFHISWITDLTPLCHLVADAVNKLPYTYSNTVLRKWAEGVLAVVYLWKVPLDNEDTVSVECQQTLALEQV